MHFSSGDRGYSRRDVANRRSQNFWEQDLEEEAGLYSPSDDTSSDDDVQGQCRGAAKVALLRLGTAGLLLGALFCALSVWHPEVLSKVAPSLSANSPFSSQEPSAPQSPSPSLPELALPQRDAPARALPAKTSGDHEHSSPPLQPGSGLQSSSNFSANPGHVNVTSGSRNATVSIEKEEQQEHSREKASCEDAEEMLLGLCYKKCSLLTNGSFPVRFAPDICRKRKPAHEISVKISILCGGYKVGADGGCPHPPTQCEIKEERFLGLCYKKCSLLTNGTHPIRSGSNSCCSQKPCWNVFHVKSSGLGCSGFGVGGGGPGGHLCSHSPEPVPVSKAESGSALAE